MYLDNLTAIRELADQRFILLKLKSDKSFIKLKFFNYFLIKNQFRLSRIEIIKR